MKAAKRNGGKREGEGLWCVCVCVCVCVCLSLSLSPTVSQLQLRQSHGHFLVQCAAVVTSFIYYFYSDLVVFLVMN